MSEKTCNSTCNSICKKSFYVLGLLTLALYFFSSVAATFGSGVAGLLETLLPYKFLIAILTVTMLYKPVGGLKKNLFWVFLAGGAIALFQGVTSVTLDENMGLTVGNVPALLSVLAGLLLMFTLPKVDLWKKVIVGLIIGILMGFQMNELGATTYTEYTKLFGDLFIDLIMMIVTPLIFFSLVSGINSISNTEALGRIGKKALMCYLTTSVFAISVGISLGNYFEPGVGFFDGVETQQEESVAKEKFELPKVLQTFLAIIPDNAIGAMAGTEVYAPKAKAGASEASKDFAADIKSKNLTLGAKPDTIQTVFFAIFVGVALVFMGTQGQRVAEVCHDAAQLMFKIIGFIINLAPLAVFGLMAWVSATLGMDALIQLGKLVGATITGMGIHYIFIITVIALVGLKPWQFIKKSIEYQMIAFSTTSSKATLATSMDVAERKLGISKPITSFILPLGAAVNMDGTAIYLGISALFFAQAYEVPLEFYHYILIIFTSTIAAVGAAGYPGGSLVVMTLVLTSIGVPTEGIAILIGVDRILDMFRTTINITSDVAITGFIDKTEGSFNKKLYDTPAEDIHEVVPAKEAAAKKTATKKTVAKKPAAKKKAAPKKKK